jgi:hypothetical protein
MWAWISDDQPAGVERLPKRAGFGQRRLPRVAFVEIFVHIMVDETAQVSSQSPVTQVAMPRGPACFTNRWMKSAHASLTQWTHELSSFISPGLYRPLGMYRPQLADCLQNYTDRCTDNSYNSYTEKSSLDCLMLCI